LTLGGHSFSDITPQMSGTENLFAFRNVSSSARSQTSTDFLLTFSPSLTSHLKAINANSAPITGSMALSEYVEMQYMP
jgi:hypothetical protein